MKRFHLLLSILAVAVWTSGCAGYRLGPVSGAAPGGRSVEVNPFVNQTLEPRLTDALTSQLRKELQREGTYRLATQQDGDIVLSGTILSYERIEMSFSKDDLLAVKDYRISMRAQVTARERGGRVLLDQPFTGYTIVRVGNDLVTAERQALPNLARELARAAVESLAEGTW